MNVVILMHSIEYDLFSMTLLLVSFKCIGDWLHDTIYYQSWCFYAYYLVYAAIRDDDLPWYYSVYQVTVSVAFAINFAFSCFTFVFLYDRKWLINFVMAICWLFYAISIFL